ncbi:MAG: hypothetical protein WC760_05140 [Bacteroidia bacterium]|jgi:hypothetical protein
MLTEEEFKKLIDALKVDLRLAEESLEETARDIIAEGFSEYPVFIATEHEVKLGELLIDKDEMAATYSIYATTLEELIERKLVLPERKAEFIKAYKNPGQFMCVMLITAEIASFVFLPYTRGGDKT